ncbi:hypothetical protein ASPCAL08364 [Aspergillus calidoustus]|uniref:Uncharacterized protein n=1 Tax=Aspergillus calidoustus TaxID=454130 RepID=A0A0U5GV56_ASPCI|nr:hypothetical protein ASPCAL08364 [Aspergillus calidoustus]
MKTTATFLATALLGSAVPALAGDLCLSSACTLAVPDQGPACGWYQMWSPGVEVCGPGTQAIRTSEHDDLEDYLTAVGPRILNDICGHTVALSWGDGAPVLDYVDVEGGTSWYQAAQNIEGETTCNYSGTDCGNAGPIFSNWYWPDLPIC